MANALSRDVSGSRGDASGYSEKKVAERFLPCSATTARGRTNFASLPHAVKKFRVLCAISPYGLLGNFWVLVTFRLGLKSGRAASSEVCVQETPARRKSSRPRKQKKSAHFVRPQSMDASAQVQSRSPACPHLQFLLSIRLMSSHKLSVDELEIRRGSTLLLQT